MALAVIGAGFGRTGTESLKRALELLGLGPCHHMTEVLPDPDQVALWRAAAAGTVPDWDAAFAGYRAAVDWPGAFFWRELCAHYPEAKVILTVRSPESWYASMEKTIFKVIESSTDPSSIGAKLIGERVFGGRYRDRAHAIAAFERNSDEVRAEIPPQRLLTYNLGDGWEPLCAFLDVAVPDARYPHTNSAAEFAAMIARMSGASDPT